MRQEEIPRVRGDRQEKIKNVPVKERSKASGSHPIDVVRRQFNFFFFLSNFFS